MKPELKLTINSQDNNDNSKCHDMAKALHEILIDLRDKFKKRNSKFCHWTLNHIFDEIYDVYDTNSIDTDFLIKKFKKNVRQEL